MSSYVHYWSELLCLITGSKPSKHTYLKGERALSPLKFGLKIPIWKDLGFLHEHQRHFKLPYQQLTL